MKTNFRGLFVWFRSCAIKIEPDHWQGVTFARQCLNACVQYRNTPLHVQYLNEKGGDCYHYHLLPVNVPCLQCDARSCVRTSL